MTWTSLRLKQVARITYGLGQPPSLSGTGIPIIRATNIERGKITGKDLIYAAEDELPLDRVPLLREGEILVVRSGAYTGDSAIVTKAWARSSPGYDLRVSPSGAHPRYVAYCLLSMPTRDQIDLAKSRAAQPHLNAEDLGAVRMMLPSLDEQCRISNFLDTEVDRINQLIRLRAAERDSIASRTAAHIDHLVLELASRYGLAAFRRMILSIEQGASPQCENFPADSGNWGVLKVSAVKSGSFVESENKQLPADFTPDRRYEIKHGDLLVTRANTPLLVGSTTVAEHPRSKLMLCDKIFRIRTTGELLPEFLVFVSLSTRIRTMCASESHGTSHSMVNLKADDIKRWPIPTAPLPTQQAVIAALREAYNHSAKLTAAIIRQIDVLSERRQALITAAVTGQIDVTTRGAAA